jgi:hypothetical protein
VTDYPAYTVEVVQTAGEKYPWVLVLRRQERKYARREVLISSHAKTLPAALQAVASRIAANRTTPPYPELL